MSPSPSPPPSPPASPPAKPAGGSGPYGSVRVTGSQAVALTFDDGPHPTYTPKVLALLRQYRVKATFCMVGTEAKRYPQLVQAIARDGHALCNHTWHHDFKLGKRSVSQIRSDLARTNAAIRAAVPGARIEYFRHPGGNWTPNAIAVARQLGMRSIHWAVDPQDWRKPPAGTVASRVINSTRAGSIVLMHDGGGERGNTCAALRSILPNLKRRFTLVAL